MSNALIEPYGPMQAENDKRRLEAEALQARLERERQELRDYIEKDNQAMKSKLTEEEEERKRKEEEMKRKMEEQKVAGAARSVGSMYNYRRFTILLLLLLLHLNSRSQLCVFHFPELN